MIKVLHCYKTALPDSTGGVEVMIDTLCRGTQRYDVQNTVFALSENPSPTPIAMPAYQLHQAKQHIFLASTGFSLSAFRQFKHLAQQADIIHYHFPNPFADILHLCCAIQKPSLVTYHSDIVKQKVLVYAYRWLQNKFLASMHHIVATSPQYAQSSSTLKRYHHKVSVIPIGVEMQPSVLDQARVAYWKNRYPQPFFLFVGALRYYKGLHIALNAISGTKLRLVIAGKGHIEKQLKAQAKRFALQHVDFVGEINEEDKRILLSLCYGFVFPSHLRSEAFGIALLEAAVAGKPLISCDINTGTSFINQHDQTGLVIPPNDANALREAMCYLLNNPIRAATMGCYAKQRAHTVFTERKQAEAYYACYRRLMNKTRANQNACCDASVS